MIISFEDQAYVLHTERTTYCFRVLPTGQLEHLYYGRKIQIEQKEDLNILTEKHRFAPGNTNLYREGESSFSLEDMRLEMSAYGKGDIREPLIEVIHADGSYTSDFVYEGAEITRGKEAFEELPGSYGTEEDVEQLCVTLVDKQYRLRLQLSYYVYTACDVITRSARLFNDSEEPVTVQRLMSMQLDLDDSFYEITSFHGAWTREMRKHTVRLDAGKYVNASYTGTSSSRANPFVMMGRPDTNDMSGSCYGWNLIYSGNHMEVFEAGSFGKMRVVMGINPTSFSWHLNPGEAFQTPEAVMTYSASGYGTMSQNLHHFIREHIVRGEWKKKNRPVLLNSWEACYFNISEHKLLKLAKSAKEAGMELFVMDDGWLGERNDDTTSLGDWEVNRKKLPGGLKGLGEKIQKMGLLFGIWVEPEMISVKSRLYESHPDWALEIPGHPHSEGRNQRILDLTREDVQEYVIQKMSDVFSQGPIDYVKWDMNRTFTDYYSQALEAKRQGEVAHRYVLGLYHVLDVLTKRFPNILFEGCAAGGNRFDLGILCYFPQIWASDDTDAICRAEIQNNYSYGYPMSVISAHVSACPNHQTLRTTPLETRYHVASYGLLGYECNLAEMSREEQEKIRVQVEQYKKWREVLQWGKFYRGRGFDGEHMNQMGSGSVLSGMHGNLMEWTCVSEDGSKAVGMLLQKLVMPNTQTHIYYPKGLLSQERYRFYNQAFKHDIREFGSLINAVSPVHIKENSFVHNMMAKVVKMNGEQEAEVAGGDALMYGGVRLAQAFSASGYDDDVRHFPDFASRLYFMEKL